MTSKTPNDVWKDYQSGQDYKNAIDLYENVRRNENFFLGKQWEGVNAPDLPKPTLNFLKRVVSYFTAMLVSDDIAVSLRPHDPDKGKEAMAKIISREIERILEQTKAKSINREAVRDAAVNGDACAYMWFDPNADSGQAVEGRIRMELIENTNVYFGNPYIHDVQDQPYIIIAQRRMLEDVKREAQKNGMSQEEIDLIKADSDSNQPEKGETNQLVTVLIRLWKGDEGHIWAQKTTETAVVKKAVDTTYGLYPVAYWSWEKVKSSCHGQAVLTGLIQNQISVNRLFAMTIRSVELTAFPKIIYNVARIPNFSNRVGEAIAVQGDIDQNIITSLRGVDVSAQVTDVIDRIVTMTRDFMGASDAALGNVKPDNTSAIIAVQQAAAVPLELQRLAMYQYVEDFIRIFADIMRADYGTRIIYVNPEDLTEEEQSMLPIPPGEMAIEFDFATLKDLNMDLNVDIGAAAYWSELAQMQTADNLLKLGLIQDAVLYLESIPSRYVKNYNKIMEALKQQQQAAVQQQNQLPPAPEELMGQAPA